MDWEMMTVAARDLLPGAWWTDPATRSELTWAAYEATYRMLMERPEATGPELPLYEPWNAWCRRRFGFLPTGAEAPDQGGLWTFASVERCARALLAGFQAKGGYDPTPTLSAEWPIRILITSNGRMPLIEGNNRVALIRVFHGLDYEFQVGVFRREDAWRSQRRYLLGVGGGRQRLYQPLPHPDFRTWEVAQPCIERWGMMAPVLGTSFRGSVLDLGCQTGWFSRAFAEAGCRVDAVDCDQRILQVAEIASEFREDGRPKPRYICGNLVDYLAARSEPADVCLFLSTIMHVFRQEGHDGGWAALRRISQLAPLLFLDCVWGGYSPHLPFSIDTICKEIIAHTEFTDARQLGWTDHEHRPFYVFTR